jgi:LysM domain
LRKARQMTVLGTREVLAGPVVRGPHRATAVPRYHRAAQRRRRPGGAPMRYRGPGVAMSRASHRRRPITPATTVGLALLAALITVWLGVVAQFGGVVGNASSSMPMPDTLAVVQVQAGETLQQVAHRVAPDAPVAHVVERIRELNQLESASLDAGQTLIAPVG